MKPDKALDRLEEDFDSSRRCPALLEAGAIDSFLLWLNNNLDYLEYLETGRWRIGVLDSQIAGRPELVTHLNDAHVEILEDTLNHTDDPLVMEILYAYFGGTGIYRRAARLLAYGRKHAEDGEDVLIISRLRSFRLIPNVQLFFLPGVVDRGSDEDALFLRAVDALNLHPDVKRAAYTRILDRDYPTAVLETVKALFEEMRQVGQIVEPNLATLDGYQLVHQALDSDRRTHRMPHIQLNTLINESEWNEQKGFHDFACGTASAVRNTIAHGPVDLPFIRERFGDRRTALKFLCLLSLLFEKLGKRTAP